MTNSRRIVVLCLALLLVLAVGAIRVPRPFDYQFTAAGQEAPPPAADGVGHRHASLGDQPAGALAATPRAWRLAAHGIPPCRGAEAPPFFDRH